uniref:Putative tick salivary metalloprotease n=1 Tax=Rhipicephalus pulchellus TaxID=72859 RepID=L7LQL2_RHIPC
MSIVQLLLIIRSCQAAQPMKYRAVVYPKLFEGRDENTKVLRINDEITLNLQRSSILHEEFFLRSYRQGVPEYRYFDVEALQEDLYHDRKHLAAVVVSEEGGTLQVEGVVGPKLKIQPVKVSERSVYGDHAHIVDTIEDSTSDNVYGVFQDNKVTVSERAGQERYGFDPSKYKVPIIHPEVLITCDSVFLKGFPNRTSMLKYVMIEFQVVIIRYSWVTNPKIHPILRAIEVTEYTEEYKYYEYISGGIDALKSLYKIRDYVATKNTSYEDFDLLYFLTGHDMIVVQDSIRESSLAGFAFVGSACTPTRQQLGEDTAYTYRGIRIMAHEMAHTLGCSHDGTAVEGHLKGFRADSSNCPWQQGYIMSYVEDSVRSMRFSTCCDYSMSQYSWMYGADCLHANSSKRILAKWTKTYKLPGEFLKRDKQCELTYPTLHKTFYMKELGIQNCMVQCFVPGEQFHASNSNWPMFLIDGSSCGTMAKRICLNGDCREDRRQARVKPSQSTPRALNN